MNVRNGLSAEGNQTLRACRVDGERVH